MITKIEIDGFKSFSDFQMEFTPFTVIAGTNASGKSNLFDALHLLSNLAVMDLRTAFSYKNLRGDVKELFTQYGDKVTARKMHFAVELLVERKIVDNWGGQCDIKTPRLRYELTIARKENGKGFEELVVEYEYLTKSIRMMINGQKNILEKKISRFGKTHRVEAVPNLIFIQSR